MCPSIRLVPTSAPGRQNDADRPASVSVDQVGADVGTPKPRLSSITCCRVSVDQVGADVGTCHSPLPPAPAIVSVDQVGADVGTPAGLGRKRHAMFGVRRSGWCRRRHPAGEPGRVVVLGCPSIRLVPTSAPPVDSHVSPPVPEVSVDQVGADVGTQAGATQAIKRGGVRRSGWCRRRHPSDVIKRRKS